MNDGSKVVRKTVQEERPVEPKEGEEKPAEQQFEKVIIARKGENKQYFECRGDKYGVFARCDNVVVGDFPEDDPFAGLSSDDEI